jgi:PleD family two-component response regulator
VLSVLQASLEVQPPEQVDRLTVSAGITELTTGDDAGGVLGRAEQALWQAKQAGNGTVVVAMTGAGARR